MQIDSLAQHQSRWQKAMEARMTWTQEAWIDLRFEANKAWSSDELDIFRSQGREASNYAIIRPVVEATCGIEAQTRADLKFLSRVSAHKDSADALTALKKYIDQQNQASRHRSATFRDAVKTGIGFLEVGLNRDPRKEQILIRREDPFNIWMDPTGKEPDLSDHLDIFRAKWLYPEYLAMLFPQFEGEIPGTSKGVGKYDPLSHTSDYTNAEGDRPPVGLFNNSGGNGDPLYGPGHGIRMPNTIEGYYSQHTDYNVKPDRYNGLLLAVERWYRVDEWATFARLRNGMVLENTPENQPVIARAMLAGECSLTQAIARRVRCALFVGDILLQDVPSPYSHGEFPFVPMWAYQDEDLTPMGMVRALRDPTKEFNARRTHLLKRATMRQVHFEDGAFVDEDEAFRELSKFNGTVRYTDGALSNGKVQIKDNLESTQVDTMLLEGAMKMVQDMSGATMEMLGQQSNANSGVAIQARQKQGQTNLYSLFDNRNWMQIHEGELCLSLIQDNYTEEQEVRITGSTKGLDYLKINSTDPTTGAKINDITQGRFDLQTAQQPESATDRAAKAQVLSDFLQNSDPGLRLIFAPQLADLNDLPEDFVEQVQQYVKQATQPQQQQPQGPAMHETIAASVKFSDLPSDQQQEFLGKFLGLQPTQIHPAVDAAWKDGKTQPDDPQQQHQQQMAMQDQKAQQAQSMQSQAQQAQAQQAQMQAEQQAQQPQDPSPQGA